MPTPIAPRTNVERELVRIWEEVLRSAPIGIQEDFFDLGGTSIQAVRVFAKIEEVFHMRLSLSVILGAPTIEKLAAAVQKSKSRDRKANAVAIQSDGEKPLFICIGGGVLWRPLSEHLGPHQPILHVGLDPASAIELLNKPNALEKLAGQMVSALCEEQPQGPYYLGGFCSDAVFAYEVARQLTMRGHEIGLLVMVEPFTPNVSAMGRITGWLKRLIFRSGFRLRELRQTGIGGFPQYARDRWNGFRTMLTQALWRNSARFRVLKNQANTLDLDQIVFVAASSYKPKPLGCPTIIFHCKDWPMLSAGDPYFGWRKFLTGSSVTLDVPGDHIGMLRDPNVAVLAEKLKDSLENTKQAKTPDYHVIADSDRMLYLDSSRA